jgi:hypothetical protein
MSHQHHILKTHADHWDDVYHGVKTFEIRRDDRNFDLGDTLELVRVDDMFGLPTPYVIPGKDGYPESRISVQFVKVTHILHGNNFSVPDSTLKGKHVAPIVPGYVVMSIRRFGLLS